MKTPICRLLFSILILFSCKHEKPVDIQSLKVVWKDIDSLSGFSKDYKLYYLDSSWNKKSTRIVDSNFIKANRAQIDDILPKGKFLNEQGFQFNFFILDTLKTEKDVDFILISGKYLYTIDPIILNQSHLFLMAVSGNKLISSFHLAHTQQNPFENSITTSVILPGFKIISRTISKWCSDFVSGNYRNCSWSKSTGFYIYDHQVERFVSYKEPINQVVHYKVKFN